MGGCCQSSSKNEGIPIDIPSDKPEKTYGDDYVFTEEDVIKIMKEIYCAKYNNKLYEKRNLQARRAKALHENKTKLNPEYIKLAKESKELESNALREAEKNIFEKYKINVESFNTAKGKIEEEKLVEDSTKGLLEEIRELEQKLGLNTAKIRKMNEMYHESYSKCDFMMRSFPEISQELSYIFEDELYLSYTDIVAADNIYNEFKLLPIEIQAFIDE